MAEQIIDKVQVEVQASAKGTSAVFEQLERRLTALQKVLNSIDTTNLQKIQKTASSTTINVNTNGISKAEKDVTKSVSKIEQALAGLQAYANAAMNGDSSSMTSFERRVISIQSQMDVLKQKFQSFGDVKIPTDAMEKLQTEMDKTSSHLESLQKRQQQMTDSGGNPKGGITQEWIDLQIALRDTKARFDDLYAAQTKLVNEGKAFDYPLQPYKEQLSSLEAQLNQTANTVRDAYSAMNETPSINPDNSGLIDTSKEAEKAREKLKKMCDSATKKAFDSLKSTLKKIASAITGIGKNADGAFGKGFMKILKYGFGIRSIYVAFRRLRKVVVESFQELQNSGAFVEETKSNIESLKNSLTLLKYQFGAAFEPIFNAVAPALKTLMNNLVSVMNTISAFIAKLMGKSTYSKAVLNAAAFADNTGKAAKAQKELNKQLQGFDELNNLTTNNSNPNSGSGGSSDDIPGAVYVEEQVDNVLGDFWKDLADKINQGDWKGVGQAISDKLSSAMESINWDDIYKKASNFGTGLAEFLNGLINPRLFGNVGKTLAGALNTAFAFLNSFGKTFDWKNFGLSIATGINEFFKTFDFKQAGETFHTWIAGALDACIAFFENTDFEQIGKAIADFIGGLNIPDLAKKLLKLAKAIIFALADAIKGLWSNGDATTRIGMAIIGLIGLSKLSGLVGTIGGLISSALGHSTITASAAGSTLKLTGLKTLVIGAATYQLAGGLAGKLFQLSADDLGLTELAKEYKKFADNPFTYTIKGVVDIATFIKEEGFEKFAKTLSDVFSPDSEFIKTLKHVFGYEEKLYKTDSPNVKDALSGKYAGHKQDIKVITQEELKQIEDLTQAFDSFKKLFKNGGGGSELNTSDLSTSMLGAWKSFTGGAEDANTKVKSLSETIKGLIDKTQNLTNNTKAFGDETENSTNKFKNGLSGIVKGSVDTFSTAYTKGTKTWSGITKWAKTKATDASDGFDSFSGVVSSEFETAYTDSTNKWSGIGTWANGVTTTTATGMGKLPTDVSKQFGDAYSQSTSKWNDLGKWASDETAIVNGTFSTFPTNASGKFGQAYTDSTDKWSGTKKWANDTFDLIQNASRTKLGTIPGQFQLNYSRGTQNAETQVSTFKSWLDRQDLIKRAGVEADESRFRNVTTKVSNISSMLSRIKNTTISVTGNGFENLGTKIKNLVSQIDKLKSKNSISLGSSIGFKLFARGGVVGGATPAIVGEAGPEAILPLTDGTIGKLADMIVGDMPITNNSMTRGYGSTSDNASEIARQNELLAEQNQLLRQIAAKELTVSSKDVFNATRSEANNYYNRTGYSPFLV